MAGYNKMKKKLISKIEDLSINAWPSFKTELYDNWLIRFSHQYTLRTNCVEQLGPSTLPISEKIVYCEQIYRDYGSPCTFKITPLIPDDFDDTLSGLGYQVKNKTDVMEMPLDRFIPRSRPQHSVILSDTITNDWIFGVFELNNITNPIHHEIVPNMFKAIPKKTIVAKIMHDGKMAASGLGILDRGVLGLYAIYTHAGHRGCGCASAICNAILEKGQMMGATHTYLQVLNNNIPALNLYTGLGYNTAYSYWFRQKDV